MPLVAYGYGGPFDPNYLLAGVDVGIQLSRSIDARLIEVIFTRPVNEADASNPANYTILPLLVIHSILKLTDLCYRLTTDRQVIDQVYEIEIANIHGVA